MKLILRGYHPQKISGKVKYIEYIYRGQQRVSIFHTWNLLNYLHPKTTYLFHGFDLHTLYQLKVFLYLLFLKLLRRPVDEIVIDSQENIFLIGLVRFLGYSKISLVFYDFATKDGTIKLRDKKFIGMVSSVTVMTEVIKRDLIKKMPELKPQQIKVIPYKVDQKIFRPFSTDENSAFRKQYNISPRYILYVGSEQSRKNMFTAVTAFQTLLKEFSDLYFVKLGRDQDIANRTKLNNILNSSPELNSRFKLIEEFTDSELVGYYNNTEVFVFPSLYEGFGIPLIEAMASGAPIVASHIDTTVEICADAIAYVHDPRDPQEFVEEIRTFLKNPKKKSLYRKKSLERSKLYVY